VTGAEPVAEGLLDKDVFQEALRAVDVLDMAGGSLGFQAQIQRVHEMVLGHVEQEADDDEASVESPSVVEEPPTLTPAHTQTKPELQVPSFSTASSLGEDGLPGEVSQNAETVPLSNPPAPESAAVEQNTDTVITIPHGASDNTGTQVEVDDGVSRHMSEQPQGPSRLQQGRTSASFGSESGKRWSCCSVMDGVCRISKALVAELVLCIGLLPYVIFVMTAGSQTLPLWELMLPIAAALLGARVVVIVLYTLVEMLNVYLVQLPSGVMLTFAACAGWPITTLIWIGLFNVLPWIDYLSQRWAAVSSIQHFWQLSLWLAVCAVTKTVLEWSLQVMLNGLTLKHYETRVESALAVYAAIRKLFLVARAAEKAQARHSRSSRRARQVAVQSAAAEAAAELTSDDVATAEGPTAIDRLQNSLGALSGPLQFGAGFRDATTIEEARKRARRAFHSLIKAQGSGEPGLRREQLLTWLDVDGKSVEASVFLVDPLREEDFVAVVERSYKEQRFITASLTSFDVCNAILRRFFIGAWAAAMALIAAFMFGIDFKEWVLPMITLSISICWVLSRILGDVIQGAIFVCWIRPFDIGDWVKLSSPGHPPHFDEMVVRSIGLWRTQFVSCTGELLLIQNSVMHGMCISNLNRSQSPCVPITIQVPAVTAPVKVTELVDCIRQYIQDRDTEWADVSLNFSSIDYRAGHMDLSIYATTRCLHTDFGALYGAKTRLLLFIHAYMQAAGMEYVRPAQPFISSTANSAFPKGSPSL